MHALQRLMLPFSMALGLSLLAALAAAGLAWPAAPPARAQTAFTATATIGLFADFARQVGGERVDVLQLLGDGVDPHGYQMTPADLVGVNRSRQLIYNGLGFEPFLSQVLTAARPDTVRVELSEGLPTIALGDAPDPHLWLDPRLAQRYVERIRDAFSAQDPAGADLYRANAARYIAELQALDSELESQLGQVPPANRKLITTHDAFNYFARRYGFELIGAVLSGEAKEPSPTEVIALLRQIRQAGVAALFVEPQFNSRQVSQIAAESGVRIVPLYSDALPADGSIRGYVAMMRANGTNIADALR